MRFIVLAIDRTLRRRTGIFEFCDDPDCLFRVSLDVAEYPLRVDNGEIPTGAKVLKLHFWNEHIPPIPQTGPTVSWAVRFRRIMGHSTHLMAEAMKRDPRLAGVKAVGGVTPLFTPGDGSPAEKIFRRLGFTSTPHQNPHGRFMEFWERVYAWLLMWAFTKGNPPKMRGLRRTDFWVSADEFLRLYEGSSRGTAGIHAPRRSRATQRWRQG